MKANIAPQRPSIRLQNQIINQITMGLKLKDKEAQKMNQVLKKNLIRRRTKKIEQNIMNEAKRRSSLNIDLKKQHETIIQKLRRKSSIKRANSHISEQEEESSPQSSQNSSNSQSSSKSSSRSNTSNSQQSSSSSKQKESTLQIEPTTINKKENLSESRKQNSNDSFRFLLQEIDAKKQKKQSSMKNSQDLQQIQSSKNNQKQQLKDSIKVNQKLSLQEAQDIMQTLDTEIYQETTKQKAQKQKLSVEIKKEPALSINHLENMSSISHLIQKDKDNEIFSPDYVQRMSPYKKITNEEITFASTLKNESKTQFAVSNILHIGLEDFDLQELENENLSKNLETKKVQQQQISEELKKSLIKEYPEIQVNPNLISKVFNQDDLNQMEKDQRNGITYLQANDISQNLQKLSSQGVQLEQMITSKRMQEEEISKNMENMENQIEIIQQQQQKLMSQMEMLLNALINKV